MSGQPTTTLRPGGHYVCRRVCEERELALENHHRAMTLLRRTWLLILVLVACADEPQSWAEVGAPCNSPDYCVSVDELRHCDDRAWTARSCASECAAQGLSTSECRSGLVGARCVCGDCPLVRSCIDTQTIQACIAGQVEAQPCAEHCMELGFAASQGCTNTSRGARCWCTDAPSCTADEPRCVEAGLLATCSAGTWRIADCSAACEGGVCTLDPDSGQHACACP
jgi:hypothetical protein